MPRWVGGHLTLVSVLLLQVVDQVDVFGLGIGGGDTLVNQLLPC